MVQIIPSREDSLDRLVDENAQQFSDDDESVEKCRASQAGGGQATYCPCNADPGGAGFDPGIVL